MPCCPFPHDQEDNVGHCMITLPHGWPPGDGETPLQSYILLLSPSRLGKPGVVVFLRPVPKLSSIGWSFGFGLSFDGGNVLGFPSLPPLMS